MTLLPDTDYTRVASMLDDIAVEQSRYRRRRLAREILLESHLSNTPDNESEDPLEDPEDHTGDRLPLAEKAGWWAMRYHLQIEGAPRKERATMEPESEGSNEETQPPRVTDVAPEVVEAWAQLAALVTTPSAIATLRHLLFQARHGNVPENARQAADAYCDLANTESRLFDAVFAARAAVRLARAVDDKERHEVALKCLAEVTRRATDGGPSQSFGAVMRGLETLLAEKAPAASELLDRAHSIWPIGEQADQLLVLALSAVTDSSERKKLWTDRVENFLTIAGHTDSNIIRATRLRQAAEIAELSGIKELRIRATKLLQDVRHLDLEMMRIHVSTRRFQEQWEETIAMVLGDLSAADGLQINTSDPEHEGESPKEKKQPTWALRLRAFGNFEAPTGDPETNRTVVRAHRAAAPLQALFPLQLQTPEGLPLFTPSNDDERFELDMVRWETQLLEQWVYILSDALQRIGAEGTPARTEVERFFLVGHAVTANEAGMLSRALERYWSGDAEAAAFTAFPLIEALLRNAALAAGQGIYRLQKKQSPGQYVGIGALLDLFVESYDVNERDRRFFNALLNHPGGWNVRNLMAHGYVLRAGSALAAVLIYASMKIVLLALEGPSDTSEQPEPE